MRTRKEIESDHKGFDALALEVLLDIRELLKPVEHIEIIEQLPFSEPPVEEQLVEEKLVKPKIRRKRRVTKKKIK